jgi:hypothetical protein
MLFPLVNAQLLSIGKWYVTHAKLMNKNNLVSLSFNSFDDNRDTDVSVNINGEHVTDDKLKKLLNTWLKAIDSELVVQ